MAEAGRDLTQAQADKKVALKGFQRAQQRADEAEVRAEKEESKVSALNSGLKEQERKAQAFASFAEQAIEAVEEELRREQARTKILGGSKADPAALDKRAAESKEEDKGGSFTLVGKHGRDWGNSLSRKEMKRRKGREGGQGQGARESKRG